MDKSKVLLNEDFEDRFTSFEGWFYFRMFERNQLVS